MRKQWTEVTKEQFFKTFDIRKSTVVETYTECSEDYAYTVFSMTGDEPTHKTEHLSLTKDPLYFVASK